MLPDPIISIEALGIEVYMYGVMIAVGIVAAFAVLFGFGKLLSLSSKLLDFIFYNGIASIAVGFGAAAVFQATYNYIEHPEAGFRFNGGITFIGGFIGGALFFLAVYFLLRKRLGIRLTDALSLIPCAILVGHAFGRVGCFFAGCCYGKATDSIWGVEFKGMSHAVHPTQLYEAIFLFVLFGVCTFLLLKFRFQYNLSLYFMAYGAFRFLIEFLRDDARGELVGSLSPSQFWSILLVVTGAVLLSVRLYLAKKSKLGSASIN